MTTPDDQRRTVSGDAALYWLRDYFAAKPGYAVDLTVYGPEVPSNHITVKGGWWFDFRYCPSWPSPQVTCALSPAHLAILNDVAAVIAIRDPEGAKP